jgi:hypothetical protein
MSTAIRINFLVGTEFSCNLAINLSNDALKRDVAPLKFNGLLLASSVRHNQLTVSDGNM